MFKDGTENNQTKSMNIHLESNRKKEVTKESINQKKNKPKTKPKKETTLYTPYQIQL